MANILVVDDSKLIAHVMHEKLEEAGHHVVACGHDGHEGFSLYQEHLPDLVLLDITMPNRDGRDCLEDILGFDPNARVVMVSSIQESEIVDACMEIGAYAFVFKPLKLRDEAFVNGFLEKLDQVLESDARAATT